MNDRKKDDMNIEINIVPDTKKLPDQNGCPLCSKHPELNKETIAAINEARNNELQRFESFDAFMQDLMATINEND